MNKKSTTARELCEHFEVSQRTIYRDIETLCQAGIPIYTTKGKKGGISILDNFVLNKSLLPDQEQNEILSALQGLKATSYSDTDKVLSKLSSIFGNKSADWIDSTEDKETVKPLNDFTDVVFHADAEIAYRIFDEFPKEAIERKPDGSFLIHAKLHAGGWLTGYLMSYEDHIELLEPKELREALIKKYQNALKKYLNY